MKGKSLLLLVFGILILVKGVWCMAGPGSIKRAAAAWAFLNEKLRPVIVGLMLAICLLLWGTVLVYDPLIDWMLGALGLWFGALAVLSLDPKRMRSLTAATALNRGTGLIRLFGAAGAALALWMIWVAVKS
ncbi:MAG: hypothetical protein FJ224_01120 [Lentisphaerae bacterium]|nr:hypothetical protein [Lentisphaerota bacterium]